MPKRRSVVLAAALVAVCAPAAQAAPAPVVPRQPNISDIANDANALNEQGATYYTGNHGDVAGPANADDRGDLLAVWFTATKTVLSIHLQTRASIAGAHTAFAFRVYTNPTMDEPVGCTKFEALVAGASWQGGPTKSQIHDLCLRPGPGQPAFTTGTVAVQAGPGSTGIVTMSFKIGSAPMIGPCATLTKPSADVRYAFGADTRAALLPVLDDTKPGTAFRLPAAGRSSRCPA
ncbi:MAG TPA: hypothetical protein VNA30_07880 [Mycobacteriales bacterium]|nr:hypothetical protein [Mycobacteriales bacterium]